MEQKKTLWIIAAVGVFLLIVLGAALIFSSNSGFELQKNNIIPVEQNQSSTWTSPSTDTFDLNAQYPNSENTNIEQPNLQFSDPNVSSVKDMVIVSENTTVFDLNQDTSTAPTTIDLNTLKTQNIYSDAPVENTKIETPKQVQVNTQENKPNEATQFYVGEARNAQKAEIAEKKTSVKQVQPKTSTATVSTPKKQSSSTSTSTKKTTTAKKQTTPSKTSTSVTSTKPVTRYWVQVASYTNKKTAENSRTILLDNKISSDIYTYQDANKKLYYRVRVGPFTTKSEAEYWMSKITQIKDFSKAGSYITSTTDK